MKKKVSVIIPTYNRSSFLKKAIESVLSQRYRDYELIVVDDGSEDDTFDLVKGFGNRVTYIRQKNKGPASARNRGIKVAKTDLLAFLDSDDWWHQDKLLIQLREMNKKPGYLISHTQEVWYKKGKLLNQKKKHKKYHGYIFDKCLPLCVVSMSTVIVRRELFDRIGLLDESLPCGEDYDFWLRASIMHPFLLVNRALTFKDGGREDQVSFVYRIGMDKFRIQAIAGVLKNANLSKEQRKLALQELRKKCLIYGNGCLKWGKTEEGKHYLALPDKLMSDD